MAFKIRDLMINIAASETGEGTADCVAGKKSDIGLPCTGKRTDADCTGKHTDIVLCVGRHTDVGICVGRRTDLGGCTGKKTDVYCTKKSPITQGDPVEVLEELNILKAQLQAELADIEQDIKEIEVSLQPKTVEEVEELQSKLKGALEELDKIKVDLKKK